MQDFTDPPNSFGEVEIQLLDQTSGRPVKSWAFPERVEITIGRSPDQDVEISDPYVSRTHARLDYTDQGWTLKSLGRHGIVVANQKVTELAVGSELTFKLGAEGPTLKFSRTSPDYVPDATITLNSDTSPMFQLDDIRLQSEVQEIAEGDYFQKLQQRAKELRMQRKQD